MQVHQSTGTGSWNVSLNGSEKITALAVSTIVHLRIRGDAGFYSACMCLGITRDQADQLRKALNQLFQDSDNQAFYTADW